MDGNRKSKLKGMKPNEASREALKEERRMA